jgi:hypothetical protein
LSVLTLFAGKETRGLVNRDILQNATCRQKLNRFAIHEHRRN